MFGSKWCGERITKDKTSVRHRISLKESVHKSWRDHFKSSCVYCLKLLGVLYAYVALKVGLHFRFGEGVRAASAVSHFFSQD